MKRLAIKYGPKVLAIGAGLELVNSARATDVDYGATLTANLITINTIWASVATIIVAVALVTVGVRFFRKAK